MLIMDYETHKKNVLQQPLSVKQWTKKNVLFQPNPYMHATFAVKLVTLLFVYYIIN